MLLKKQLTMSFDVQKRATMATVITRSSRLSKSRYTQNTTTMGTASRVPQNLRQKCLSSTSQILLLLASLLLALGSLPVPHTHAASVSTTTIAAKSSAAMKNFGDGSADNRRDQNPVAPLTGVGFFYKICTS